MTATSMIMFFILSLFPPGWMVYMMEIMCLNLLMKMIDSLASECIIELIVKLPCLWLRLRVFSKIERTPSTGSKGLTTDYLLISPVFGNWNNALHHQPGLLIKAYISKFNYLFTSSSPPSLLTCEKWNGKVNDDIRKEWIRMDGNQKHAC